MTLSGACATLAPRPKIPGGDIIDQACAGRDEADDVVKVIVVVEPSNPRWIRQTGIRERRQSREHSDEHEGRHARYGPPSDHNGSDYTLTVPLSRSVCRPSIPTWRLRTAARLAEAVQVKGRRSEAHYRKSGSSTQQ